MHIIIESCLWYRRGQDHTRRPPQRKREQRATGFLGPHAARLRRCMKRRHHRAARRHIRAALRAICQTGHPVEVLP